MGNNQSDNSNEAVDKNSIEKNENDNKNKESKNTNDNNNGNKVNIALTKKKYVWIDPKINNKENLFFYNILFGEKKINCIKFDNIDGAYNYLNQKINEFEEIVIIISGKFLINFYYKLKNNI